MKLSKTIIALTFFSLFTPWINAQQRFEISAGVSSPGFHTWEKGAALNNSYFPEDYKFNKLSDMDGFAYRSTYYPGFSIQAAYKLPDHGFTKKLSILAYAGLNTAGFEKFDYLTNKSLYSETAFKFDLMAGIRLHLITKDHFMMYTQAMVGLQIKDKSHYWDYNHYIAKDPVAIQMTFLGFRFKSDSGLCYLAELGTGSEYEFSGMLLIPGVRIGLGYTF